MKNQKLIEHPDSDTLYQKIGKRYIPVSQYATIDYWREGTYLVQIRPGMRSYQRMIYPKKADDVEATLKLLQEGILQKMLEKRSVPNSPTREKLTPKQVKAFQVWKEAFGQDTVWLPSAAEIVEAGLEEVRKYWEEIKGT